jgi:EmrB/QacA subfamily drug resistance transporter
MNVTPEAQSGTVKPVHERLDPALIRLIVVLLTGGIPALLDTSIVNVAVDTIGRDLHTTVSVIQWVITGYLLSFAMVIPLSGWALARFGGRAVWMFSLALFLAGSVACGASWNIGSLITFRVIQGIGGGMLTPLITTLLVRAAGGRHLGRLMAAVSLPVVVVPIFGPVIAGLIISNISWRWIFYVNVPLCLLGLALAWRELPASRPQGGASRIDVVGLALLPPALLALLYGLAEVSSAGGFGHGDVLIPVAIGAVLLAAYCWHALHTSVTPMVDLRLFRARAFTGASTLLFLAGLSIYGAMLLLPLYFQVVRHDSALVAGLLMVPQGLGSLAPRTLAGKLTDRIGPRPVVLAGVVLSAAGTVPFALAGLHTNYWLLGAALVVRGAGLGTATIAVMVGAFQGLGGEQVPHASSATRIVQYIGGSFGAAVLVAAILDRQAAAHAAAGAAGLATAYANTFWWCTGFTALALVPALLLPGAARTVSSLRRKERPPHPPAAPDPGT